jgi:hypothetical protein
MRLFDHVNAESFSFLRYFYLWVRIKVSAHDISVFFEAVVTRENSVRFQQLRTLSVCLKMTRNERHLWNECNCLELLKKLPWFATPYCVEKLLSANSQAVLSINQKKSMCIWNLLRRRKCSLKKQPTHTFP